MRISCNFVRVKDRFPSKGLKRGRTHVTYSLQIHVSCDMPIVYFVVDCSRNSAMYIELGGAVWGGVC